MHKPETSDLFTVEKSGLLPYILKVCTSLRPDMIVLENVPNAEKTQLPEITEALIAAGYAVESVFGTARDQGFDHERKRLYIVAVLKESRFMASIATLPFAPLSTLLPDRRVAMPHHRSVVLDMPVYAARRHGLGNALVPACALYCTQLALHQCISNHQLWPTPPPRPALPRLKPRMPKLYVNSNAYHPPPGYVPTSPDFDPSHILPPGREAAKAWTPTKNIACSHYLTNRTQSDPDCIMRFANITPSGQRGLPWQWNVEHVEYQMGVPVGWTRIEPQFWAELQAFSAQRRDASRAVVTNRRACESLVRQAEADRAAIEAKRAECKRRREQQS
jgi:hypothetical protein